MSLPRGAARVRAAFDHTRDAGRSALVAYLMAGYPDDDASLAAAEAALAGGADLLEIGVPFSDPVADGPVVAAAGHAAVASGGGIESAMRLVRALRASGHEQPVLAMGYLNPLVARGAPGTLAGLASAGVDALIVPDLPAGEDPQLERLVAHAGLGIVFLVTPNTAPERMERAIRASTAFLYVVPLYGVTGTRESVAATTLPLLRRIGAAVGGRLPVAVGFGISNAGHVRELSPVVDGIIVGSAIVQAIGDRGPQGVGALVASLASATGRPAQP
ncbi:MAG: tryptophan synthase subunit alpha [Candidatus Limnocylindria bacterium]